MDVERHGIIKTVIEPKGYGFLRELPNGPERFFHASELVAPLTLQDLRAGMVVCFVPTQHRDGRDRAAAVRLADRQPGEV